MNPTDEWYDVSRLTDRSYRITEAETYGSFLIEGAVRSVLVDAGIGVGKLAELADGLVETPITLALTHTHWDHIGAAAEFEDVLVAPAELPPDGRIAIDSISGEFADRPAQFAERWLGGGNEFPDGVTPETYTIDPAGAGLLPEDGSIDLGDRSLEVVPLPGHSPGHVGFLDPETDTLYGGDVPHYGGGLYLQFEGCDLDACIESLARIKELHEAGAFETLVTSHNDPIAGEGLSIVEDLLRGLEGTGRPTPIRSSRRSGTRSSPRGKESTAKTGSSPRTGRSSIWPKPQTGTGRTIPARSTSRRSSSGGRSIRPRPGRTRFASTIGSRCRTTRRRTPRSPAGRISSTSNVGGRRSTGRSMRSRRMPSGRDERPADRSGPFLSSPAESRTMMDPDGRNVLLVVLDTVRKDHLTPYGYGRETTPTLGAFADDARVYEEATSQAPWTLPSHASLFTGRYPAEHMATQESPYLPDGVGTLAETLSLSGYRTACYSSNAWITPYTRLTAGFDEHDSFFEALPGGSVPSVAATLWQRLTDGRLRPLADRLIEAGNAVHERLAADDDSKTPAAIDRTRSFIEETDDRWFVFLNLMDAHLPYRPPEKYRQQFAPDVDPDGVCQNSKTHNSGARTVSDDEFDSIRGLYDAEIRRMDAEINCLFEFLKRTDRWEETVVIVCSDHGELHGEFGLYGHEFAVYDPLVNVPLLVKHPDLEPGRDGRIVELLDLYDTVLESASATDPAGKTDARPFESGRSLLSAERSTPDGRYAFVEYYRPVIERRQLETKAKRAGTELGSESRFDSRICAVRSTDGKYVHNERFPDEAYELGEGLGEREPIDPDGAVARELSAALGRFGERVESACTESGGLQSPDGNESRETIKGMDAETRRRLRELGYL